MSLFSRIGGISPVSAYCPSMSFGSSGSCPVYVLMISLAVSLNIELRPACVSPKFMAIDLFAICCMLMVLFMTVPLYMRSMSDPSQ